MRNGAILLGLLICAVGCGGPKPATIGGEVKLPNDKPLEKGTIMFIPADEQGQPVSTEIKNGKYEVKTFAGKFLVQISAPKVIGRHAETGTDITEELLAEKFNINTELNFEAKPGGNQKDWAVEPIKK